MAQSYKQYDFPKTRDQLNQLIADISQLKVNVRQIHWYMRGPEFFRMHPQMDDYLDQLDDMLDDIAERLIQLGGSPYSTTHEFIEHTGLPDDKTSWGSTSLPDYIQQLSDQFKYLRDQIELGMEVSDDEKDWPTQDMLNGFKMSVDKNVWMLNAFLGKGAQD
ncbi:MAG: DNA starvation/stationary phase protection protein [Furfurilactobacillus sp.]|jgi:starvation-inducible DNA-binding protein|uniref:DNA starvation/stationary phase protection protein n=1 Tax=Furfurilactobacillus milii TaxID=2888272 RepID=A0ABT6D8Y1_9LACO|nr:MULTISPECIES: DNA starvation/stationary phase protection protein [Furfurilactobacillus]QLE65804.1 Ferritin Dps protein [Furfurilactobacillus rossiae]MCF6160285.1 DNA starvation/stationary phase protection protein [Furfurilactobacillus milii]MCF6162228.1 DNA starvation/stationary phase protection protein [Furfurilactobacillus milii]MCF6420429.1 DNA starvation/stationary phase protection protein [Furfurilactobacillus milii]MCH4012328.1 DNA starvation/stationary phase protection protein [Furfu